MNKYYLFIAYYVPITIECEVNDLEAKILILTQR